MYEIPSYTIHWSEFPEIVCSPKWFILLRKSLVIIVFSPTTCPCPKDNSDFQEIQNCLKDAQSRTSGVSSSDIVSLPQGNELQYRILEYVISLPMIISLDGLRVSNDSASMTLISLQDLTSKRKCDVCCNGSLFSLQ